MANKAALATCAALLSVGVSGNAAAQDAAETAQILSGTGQSQGRASRSLGSAISQSMNAARDAIATTRAAEPVTSRRRFRTAHEPYPIPANVDGLAGTDAPTYRLGNGSSIRVSGRLLQAPGTSCVSDCPEKRVP